MTFHWMGVPRENIVQLILSGSGSPLAKLFTVKSVSLDPPIEISAWVTFMFPPEPVMQVSVTGPFPIVPTSIHFATSYCWLRLISQVLPGRYVNCTTLISPPTAQVVLLGGST